MRDNFIKLTEKLYIFGIVIKKMLKFAFKS